MCAPRLKPRKQRPKPCPGPQGTGILYQPKILVFYRKKNKILASLYPRKPYYLPGGISQSKVTIRLWQTQLASAYVPRDTEWVSGKANHHDLHTPICQLGTDSVSLYYFLLIDVKYTCKHSSLFYQHNLLKLIYKKTLSSL